MKHVPLLAAALVTALVLVPASATASQARVANYRTFWDSMLPGTALVLEANGALRVGVGNNDHWFFVVSETVYGDQKTPDACYMVGSVEAGFVLDPQMGCASGRTLTIGGTGGVSLGPDVDTVTVRYHGQPYTANVVAA